MKQKSVGLTLRAFIIALALILVAGSPALPPFDGVAYAQDDEVTDLSWLTLPNGSLQLEWKEVDEATTYNVWKGEGRGQNVNWEETASASIAAPELMHTDSAVTAGMTYSYVIEVHDDEGNRLGWSDVENVTIPGGVQKPTDEPVLTLTADGLTAITVSWTAVDRAETYRLRYWTDGIGLTGWVDLETATTNRTYSHTGLTPGKEYYYIVRGQNSAGGGPFTGDDGANYDSLTLQATTAVPQLSLEHLSRTSVRLTWTLTTDAVNYELERERVVTGAGAETDAYSRLPSSLLTGTTYTDNAANFVIADGATADATTVVMYNYRVQAIDSNGVRGTWSNVESVTIPQTSNRLLPPTTLTAAAADHANITVSWPGVVGAEYYHVQSKTGDGDYSSPVRVAALADATSMVTYNHGSLNPSTAYTYQVRASNINGPSDWSAEASATTHATPSASGQMPQVAGLRVTDTSTATQRKIKLTWSAVSGATHYDIRRYSPDGATVSWANPADGNMLTTGRISVTDAGSSPTWEDEDTALAAAATYYYIVSAVDNRGTDGNAADDDMGNWSAEGKVTLDDIAPEVPTNLTASTTGQRSIWVSWTASAVDASTDPDTKTATHYTLEWRLTGQNAAWNPMTVNGTTYNHTGRQPNTQYHYRVRAHNSGGMSAYTGETSTTTLPSVLGPPSSLTVVDASEAATAGITVSWTAVTGATSYEIQRFGAGTANNEWGDLAGVADLDTDVSSGTMVTDNVDRMFNTTYSYRVRTVAAEDVKSQWSTVYSGATKHATPTTAPTLVATSTGMNMIRLSWSTVADATNYELEWLEGMHDAATFNNALITRGEMTLAGTDRHYVHRSLKAGTLYSYRLRAVLPQGVESPWSTVAEQYTKPERPASLTARSTVSPTMVLTWTPVSFVGTDGAAGTLTAAANYQVERRESGSADWMASAGTVDCTTTVGTCTITDGNTDPAAADALDANTHYFYRVRATVDRTPTGGAATTYMSYWTYTNQRTPQ